MKIAIIGGGIFGITCAIKLAPENQVTIFEKNNDILKSASDTHQCRIHRGYHYPRSDKTVQELLKSEPNFVNEFSDAVVKTTENFYFVSKNDSLVSADEYIDFCNRNSLEFEKSDLKNKKTFLKGLLDKIIVESKYGVDRDNKKIQTGHSLTFHFKMKIVNDKLIYKDKSKKSLGYEI